MTFDPSFEEFKRQRELERTRRQGRGDELRRNHAPWGPITPVTGHDQ